MCGKTYVSHLFLETFRKMSTYLRHYIVIANDIELENRVNSFPGKFAHNVHIFLKTKYTNCTRFFQIIGSVFRKT